MLDSIKKRRFFYHDSSCEVADVCITDIENFGILLSERFEFLETYFKDSNDDRFDDTIFTTTAANNLFSC
jgi:hypothetical protein